LLNITWNEFEKLFKNAFFPSTNVYGYVDDYDYLNWRQGPEMNVATYVMGFKTRQQAKEGDTSSKFAISKFMWGLKTPIRKYVEQSKPIDIENAYKLAYDDDVTAESLTVFSPS
jgi:hypothetical protein